jgi:hypothetical protein
MSAGLKDLYKQGMIVARAAAAAAAAVAGTRRHDVATNAVYLPAASLLLGIYNSM